MVRIGIAFILSILMSMFFIGIASSICQRFGLATSITTLDHPFISVSILILAISLTAVVNKILKELTNRLRFFLHHNPDNARKLLWTATLSANVIALFVVIVGTYELLRLDSGRMLPIPYGIATLLWGLGRRAKRVRRRLEASTSIKKINSNHAKVDGQPSILLLRSFVDDNFEYMSRQPFYREYFNVTASNLAPLVEGRTFEETINDAISPHGYVIAIGRPGEELAPLGAHRFYVPDNENWEDHVSEIMRGCAVVVLVLGRSVGFGWELDQLSKGKQLAKVLLLVPPVSTKEKLARWEFFLERLSVTGSTPQCVGFDISKVLLMTFDPDLTCHPIYGKTTSAAHYSKPIAEALKRLGSSGDTLPPTGEPSYTAAKARGSGAIAGASAGVGGLLGICSYVTIRVGITGNYTLYTLELVVAFFIGAALGWLLYGWWAGRARGEDREGGLRQADGKMVGGEEEHTSRATDQHER